MAPGLLLVFAETGKDVTEEEFHDWYGNEHIPLRTSTLPAFQTAVRYQAHDSKKPKWAAIYSISDDAVFADHNYTKLRANRSPREADVVKRLEVLDRRIYRLISDPSAMPSPLSPAPGLVILDSVTPTQSHQPEFSDSEWAGSRLKRLESIPGFVRSRRFETVDVVRIGSGVVKGDEKEVPTFLELTEFETPESLQSREYEDLRKETDEARFSGSAEKREFRILRLLKQYSPDAALKAIS